jgi:hypothetical protein
VALLCISDSDEGEPEQHPDGLGLLRFERRVGQLEDGGKGGWVCWCWGGSGGNGEDWYGGAGSRGGEEGLPQGSLGSRRT